MSWRFSQVTKVVLEHASRTSIFQKETLGSRASSEGESTHSYNEKIQIFSGV